MRVLSRARYQRLAPRCSELTSRAPARSQEAVSLTTIAALPARSWSRVITERPLLTATSATLQPTGSSCTQGTSDADGTDWAINHSGWRSPQPASLTPSGVSTRFSVLKTYLEFTVAKTTRARISAHSPTRRALQRWTRIGRGGLGS